MRIKGLVDEDFVNFKLPSMYIIFPNCSFKCDRENGNQLCQNSHLVNDPTIELPKEEIIERYIANPISKAFVLAGLEPFDSEMDLMAFVDCVRRQYNLDDPIVIYTGYTEEELNEGKWGHGAPESQQQFWKILTHYKNIIVKFGRFRPDYAARFDDVLGVTLVSMNQYARKFNYEYDNKTKS